MTADVLDRPDVAADKERVLVTLTVADQLCGIPVLSVRDILGVQSITRIPLAPPEIAGSLNLRGRIVTVIDLANRLQLQSSRDTVASMVIGLELGAESFGILVDSVTEVLSLPDGEREASPINLDHKLGGVSAGVFRLDQALLVVLDADRILDIRSRAAAA